ncbi:MAG: hypothetical protein LUC93_11145 [Planctomycetaceae bacterium]|nr:hypothetical protein [Planctomycetaceae bacterium]
MTAITTEPVEVRAPYTKLHVLMAILLTLVATWILSFIYGLADHYSPLVYLNIALAFGYGFCIGFVAQTMMRRLRINGNVAALAIGLICGIVGLYLAWPAYLWVITDFDMEIYTDTLGSPSFIWFIMHQLAVDPMWSLGKSQSSFPTMYWIAWLGEALLVIGPVVFACTNLVKTNLLCDTCKDWVAVTGDKALLHIPEDRVDEVIASVSNGDLTVLLPLQHLTVDEADQIGQWLEAVGYACPNCTHMNGYVDVSLVMLRPAKKKKELERTSKTLVKLAEIDVETEKSLFEPEPAPVEEDGIEPEPAEAMTEGEVNG